MLWISCARVLLLAGALLTGCTQRTAPPPSVGCQQPPASPEDLRRSPGLLRAEQKRQRMEGILGEGSSVMLQLDARRQDVKVPVEHKSNGNLVLEYARGASMYKPIVDLAVCPEGVHGTLSFKSVNFTTFVPWSAVFAMSSKAGTDGTTWEEDVPKDQAAKEAKE